MSEKRTVLPTKLPTAMDHEMALPKSEVTHYPVSGEADQPKPAAANAHISEKVYMLPESYNALRRELDENWPTLFALVGYAMAFDAPRFIELMDDALDTKTTFDTAKVDGICKKYLDCLRVKRGLSPLHGSMFMQQDAKIILPGDF